MRKRFSRWSGGGRRLRPARQWLPIPSTLMFNAITSTQVQSVLAFEEPTVTPGTPLTAEPPEDQTLLRITGAIRVGILASGCWTLSLLLVDRTWTPIGGEFATDADKRILWSETYSTVAMAATLAGFGSASWQTPNQVVIDATTDQVVECKPSAVYIDIAPKVKLEAGKHLVFLASENENGGTLSMRNEWMRVLMQRSGRR